MRKKRKLICLFFLFFVLSFVISLIIEKRASPLLEYYATAQGTTAATEIINAAAASALEEIEDFTLYEKNSDGTVIINAENVSRIKATVTSEIVKSLRKIEELEISVSYGTLTGISLFFGKGPKIKLRLIPEGKVTTETRTEFYSTGINQTVHRIYLQIKTEFFVILPDKTVTVSVDESFPITETLILGDIPQVYLQNQGDRNAAKNKGPNRETPLLQQKVLYRRLTRNFRL